MLALKFASDLFQFQPFSQIVIPQKIKFILMKSRILLHCRWRSCRWRRRWRFCLRRTKYKRIITASVVYVNFLDQFQSFNGHFCHTATTCRIDGVANLLSTYFGSVEVVYEEKLNNQKTHEHIIIFVRWFIFFVVVYLKPFFLYKYCLQSVSGIIKIVGPVRDKIVGITVYIKMFKRDIVSK